MKGKSRHNQLCRAVRETLAAYGYLAFPVRQIPTPVPGKSGVWRRPGSAMVPGVADVIACAPGGRFVAVEVKIGRDRLRPAQKQFLESVEKLGGIAVVCRDTVDALVEVLKKRRNDAEEKI